MDRNGSIDKKPDSILLHKASTRTRTSGNQASTSGPSETGTGNFSSSPDAQNGHGYPHPVFIVSSTPYAATGALQGAPNNNFLYPPTAVTQPPSPYTAMYPHGVLPMSQTSTDTSTSSNTHSPSALSSTSNANIPTIHAWLRFLGHHHNPQQCHQLEGVDFKSVNDKLKDAGFNVLSQLVSEHVTPKTLHKYTGILPGSYTPPLSV